MKESLRTLSFLMILFLTCVPVMAQTAQGLTGNEYHSQISQLWSQKKATYTEMAKKSQDNPQLLYNIQSETNNLLKYAAFSQNHALLEELSGLYLNALDTLTTTDQYLYAYYPGSPKRTVHRLDKKYRMWVDKQKPIGDESILSSSQFLYLLSDAVHIIADIRKEKRTPIMKDALNKFIPLLIENYDRWLYSATGPFQVHGWGCRFDGKPVPVGMNHIELLNRKLDRKLGNGESPSYCNAVTDIDMWIIAGVANLLAVHRKESLPMAPAEYTKFIDYVRVGVKLLESRFRDTALKNFDGQPATGTIFDAGVWDEHPDHEFAGYSGQDFTKISAEEKLRYRGKNLGWDVSHARRFVHVFETLLMSRDVLKLDFPTRDHMVKMANQLVYGTFNRDFKKPLFANYMDGTNGWYRAGFSGRPGFGYGPSDLSMSVLEGGFGFWSRYSVDVQRVFVALMDMLKSKDPEIRRHVAEHYETSYWNQYKRTRDYDFNDPRNPRTQSAFIQYYPSLFFMIEN
jgi:hypothetical protein